jgi:hypothetical protein
MLLSHLTHYYMSFNITKGLYPRQLLTECVIHCWLWWKRLSLLLFFASYGEKTQSAIAIIHCWLWWKDSVCYCYYSLLAMVKRLSLLFCYYSLLAMVKRLSMLMMPNSWLVVTSVELEKKKIKRKKKLWSTYFTKLGKKKTLKKKKTLVHLFHKIGRETKKTLVQTCYHIPWIGPVVALG